MRNLIKITTTIFTLLLVSVAVLVTTQNPNKITLDDLLDRVQIVYTEGDSEDHVTNRIYLPEGIDELPGYKVTWRQDESEYIKIIENYADILRPQDKDEIVQIYAILQDELNTSGEKAFKLTIKKEDVIVNPEIDAKKKELQDLIDKLTPTKEDIDMYTEESITNLVDELNRAQNELDTNINISIEEIDELIKHLKDAHKELEIKPELILEELRLKLINKIKEKEAMLDSLVYTEKSINDAQVIIDATKEFVDSNNKDILIAAINSLDEVDSILVTIDDQKLIDKKEELNDLINKLTPTEEDKDIYTEDSIKDLEDSINNAIDQLENNNDLTVEDIDDLIEDLNNSHNNLVTKDDELIEIEKELLRKTIKYAQDRLVKDIYVPSTVLEANKAINHGLQLLEDEDVALSMLEKAIKDLKEVNYIIQANYEKLELAIAKLENEISKVDIYTKESIDQAKELLFSAYKVLNNKEISIDEQNIIDDVVKTIKEFKFETITEQEITTDKEELKLIIEQAKEMLKNENDYIAKSYELLKENTEEAINVYDNSNDTNEIKDIIIKLKNTIEEMISIKELRILVEELVKEIDLNESNYFEKSVKEARKLIEESREVMINATNQKVVDEQVQKLENFELLTKEEGANLDKLIKLINDFKELTKENYTTNSYNDLKEYVIEAEELIDLENNPSSAKVENIISLIEEAFEGLVDISELIEKVESFKEVIEKSNLIETNKNEALALVNRAEKLILKADISELVKEKEKLAIKLEDKELYTKESYDNAKSLLDDANKLINNMNISVKDQDVVDQLVEKIINVVLVTKEDDFNYQQLIELINKVNNLESRDYTKSTYEKLINTKLLAEELLDENNNPSMEEVLEFISQLSKEIDELISIKDLREKVESLEEEITDYVENGFYTEESSKSFKEIYAESKEVLNNPNASKTDVEDMLEKITNVFKFNFRIKKVVENEYEFEYAILDTNIKIIEFANDIKVKNKFKENIKVSGRTSLEIDGKNYSLDITEMNTRQTSFMKFDRVNMLTIRNINVVNTKENNDFYNLLTIESSYEVTIENMNFSEGEFKVAPIEISYTSKVHIYNIKNDIEKAHSATISIDSYSTEYYVDYNEDFFMAEDIRAAGPIQWVMNYFVNTDKSEVRFLARLTKLVRDKVNNDDLKYTKESYEEYLETYNKSFKYFNETRIYILGDMNRYATELSKAKDNLVLVEMVNKKLELEKLINDFEKLNKDDYSMKTYNHLLDLVTEAKELLNEDKVKLEDIKDSILKVKDAFSKLTNIIEIKNIIQEYELINKKLYSIYSVNKLNETFNKVISLVESGEIYLDDVSDLIEEMNLAISSLVRIDDFKDVLNDFLEKIESNNYTQKTTEEAKELYEEMFILANGDEKIDRSEIESYIAKIENFEFVIKINDSTWSDLMDIISKAEKAIKDENSYTISTINELKETHNEYKDIDLTTDSQTKGEKALSEYRKSINGLVYIKELVDEIRSFKIKLQSLDLTKENEYEATLLLEKSTEVSLNNNVTQNEVDVQLSKLKEFKFIESANFEKLIEITNYIVKSYEENKYVDEEILEIKNSEDFLEAIKLIDEKSLSNKEQNIVDQLYNKLNNEVKELESLVYKAYVIFLEDMISKVVGIDYTVETINVYNEYMDRYEHLSKYWQDEMILKARQNIQSAYDNLVYIKDLKIIVKQLKEEIDETLYTEESINEAKELIRNAEKLYIDATIENIEKMKEDINEFSFYTLSLKDIIEKLKIEVEEFKNSDENDYDEDVYNLLKEEVNKAIELINEYRPNEQLAKEILVEIIRLKNLSSVPEKLVEKIDFYDKYVKELYYRKEDYLIAKKLIEKANDIVNGKIKATEEEVKELLEEMDNFYEHTQVIYIAVSDNARFVDSFKDENIERIKVFKKHGTVVTLNVSIPKENINFQSKKTIEIILKPGVNLNVSGEIKLTYKGNQNILVIIKVEKGAEFSDDNIDKINNGLSVIVERE